VAEARAARRPTGEFAGMGIEGNIKLGQRKQLEAIEDPVELAMGRRAILAPLIIFQS
jgi:hypothetical protein